MAVETATFKTNYPEWHKAFEDWVIVAGLGIVDAFRYQAKQIASALVLGYEPSGKKSWNQSTPPNDKKQGEAAVVRDIRRSIYPLRSDGFRDVKVRRDVRRVLQSEDMAAIEVMLRRGVWGQAIKNAKLFPAGNEYTAHQNSRRSRGKVTMKKPNNAIPARTWEYLRAYEKEAKHGVGQAKGGWASSLITLGGRVPDWIGRHKKAGTCIDNLKPNQTNIGFSMINRSKWGMFDEGSESQRITDQIVSNREELIKADIELLLTNGWKRTADGRIQK